MISLNLWIAKFKTVIANKHFLYPFFFLLVALHCTPCLGQKKYEREYTVKADSVPDSAALFVSRLFNNSKVHWYMEESDTTKSIEAKLKHSGKHYSIEFDESGQIQDIEILINIRDLEKNTRSKIKDNLNATFKRQKIIKTQLQWVGSENSLERAVLANMPLEGIIVKYEIVVRGQTENVEAYFEVLFDSTGRIESTMEIALANDDNLIY
ncbi:hypothetical protein [Dyadobacter sp. CY347]|uniref:hypothetical protein n=1 Tax=Dyadobacter sp. CY347 TaxID=2909336 RepID=UPI001F3FAA3E|nr:hypothetical protein [Dyadobacter sp. CY347]MCF2487753.1 hypothetical protein [Dyadobacter sp. CY347]